VSSPSRRDGPRARPVADAPVDALLARGEELAGRWAAAMILARPLERIGELSLDSFAREAPALCDQMSRALGSDAELEQMGGQREAGVPGQGGRARSLAVIAGARDPRSTVEAAETLRRVIWEALLEELRAPSARLVADLSDRLAHVCVTLIAAAISETASGRADSSAGPREPELEDPVRVVSAPDPTSAPRTPPVARHAGVLIDEREEAPARPREGNWQQPVPPSAERPRVRPFPWEPPRVPSEAPIAIRDERGEEGPAAWIRSIGRQLECFARDGRPFAVLLVDLGDLERSTHAGPTGGPSSATSLVERLLAQQLHRYEGASAEDRGGSAGSLTRERSGRYWLLVTDTDAIAAGRLAESLVGAIRPLTASRWPWLEVMVGTAVCPDDGRDAAALAACADMGIYAARTAARSTASADEPA